AFGREPVHVNRGIDDLRLPAVDPLDALRDEARVGDEDVDALRGLEILTAESLEDRTPEQRGRSAPVLLVEVPEIAGGRMAVAHVQGIPDRDRLRHRVAAREDDVEAVDLESRPDARHQGQRQPVERPDAGDPVEPGGPDVAVREDGRGPSIRLRDQHEDRRVGVDARERLQHAFRAAPGHEPFVDERDSGPHARHERASSCGFWCISEPWFWSSPGRGDVNIGVRSPLSMEAAIRLIARLVLVFLGVAEAASAQSLPVSDPLTDYLRILEISGAGAPAASFARPAELSAGWLQGLGPHPWMERVERELGMGGASAEQSGGVSIRPTGARLQTFVNTAHPSGFNDGAVWQGRGLSMGLDGGVEVAWKGVTARLHPTVTFAQNAAFTLAPAYWPDLEEIAYPWRVIDLPQRMGTRSRAARGLRDSEIRLDVPGVTPGVGNRARWRGPRIRNALLLSADAPGLRPA